MLDLQSYCLQALGCIADRGGKPDDMLGQISNLAQHNVVSVATTSDLSILVMYDSLMIGDFAFTTVSEQLCLADSASTQLPCRGLLSKLASTRMGHIAMATAADTGMPHWEEEKSGLSCHVLQAPLQGTAKKNQVLIKRVVPQDQSFGGSVVSYAEEGAKAV